MIHINQYYDSRLKGIALVEGRPNVEILYYMAREQPQLKVGFQFKAKQLSKIITMFYGEKKMTSAWMKFSEICKFMVYLLNI